jgi:hypothetical protein
MCQAIGQIEKMMHQMQEMQQQQSQGCQGGGDDDKCQKGGDEFKQIMQQLQQMFQGGG